MRAVNYASIVFFLLLILMLLVGENASSDVNATRVKSERVIKIMILDTGIERDHIMFKGRNVTCANPQSCKDEVGHGTQVASLALNGEISLANGRVTSTAPTCLNVQLTSCRIFNGVFSLEDMKNCMKLATDEQYDIINYSLNGGDFLLPEYRAFANFKGIATVAAGNEGRDIGKDPTFPAALNILNKFSSYKGYKPLVNVISVGALTSDDKRWIDSNYGPVSAWRKGARVISATVGNKFQRSSGTSYAAPRYANELLRKACNGDL